MHPLLRRTEVLFEGRGRVLQASIALADGVVVEREVSAHGEAAAVLPYDADRRTALLVRQLRVGALLVAEADPFLLEAPAGMVEDEAPDAAAIREALEEAGVRLRSLTPVGCSYPTAGVSSERLHLFLAPYGAADRVGQGGGEPSENEHTEVVELSLSELWRLIDAGQLRDLKTIALGSVLKAKRPELFI